MTNKIVLSLADVNDAAAELARKIYNDIGYGARIYGVPRGGIPAAYAIAQQSYKNLADFEVVDSPLRANAIVDDLVDSGRTKDRMLETFNLPFYSLFVKEDPKEWLVFPWEVTDASEDVSQYDIVTRMLQAIGEDPSREGLVETPTRVAKAWETWFSGYGRDPAEVLKTFEDGAENVDEMVLETHIPVYSFCEHHMAPIFGVAHVAYVPNGKVVGLSKLVRLVDIFARRLQVQERLTTQIASAIDKNLNPLGVGVVLQCRHMCMESRGVHSQGVVTTTSSLRGVMKTQPDARAEFMTLIRMNKLGGAVV